MLKSNKTALLLSLVSLLLLNSCNAKQETPKQQPSQNTTTSANFELNKILDTELFTISGDTTTLNKLAQGKKGILIDFWASWCGPCLQNMPNLKADADKYGDQILITGLNLEHSLSKASRIWKSNQWKLHESKNLVWLIEPESRTISNYFKVSSIPRAILIDSNQNVVFDGHAASPKLKEAIQALLK